MPTLRTVVAGSVLTALALAGLGMQSPGSPPAPPSVPIHQAWIPPGTYSAIVLSTNAKERRWIVSVRVRDGSFPVVIPPGGTVVLPFEGGWAVLGSDNARVESQYAPFADPTRSNLMDGNENLTVSVWGITKNGPVAFQPPKKP